LGAYSSVALLIVLWTPMRRRARILIVSLLGLTILFSGARAAWLAVATGVVLTALVVAFQKRKASGDVRPLRTIFVIGLGVLAALAFSGTLRHSVTVRIETVLGGPVNVTSTSSQSEISAQARRNQNASLRELAKTAPWYGQGLTASGRVQAFGGIDYGTTATTEASNNVGSNWILAWWAEGKYLAIPTFVLFAFAVKRGLKAGPGVVLAALLVNNLFTNTSFMPITWFVLGLSFLAAEHVRLRTQERPSRKY
jgi:hypothetical protein